MSATRKHWVNAQSILCAALVLSSPRVVVVVVVFFIKKLHVKQDVTSMIVNIFQLDKVNQESTILKELESLEIGVWHMLTYHKFVQLGASKRQTPRRLFETLKGTLNYHSAVDTPPEQRGGKWHLCDFVSWNCPFLVLKDTKQYNTNQTVFSTGFNWVLSNSKGIVFLRFQSADEITRNISFCYSHGVPHAVDSTLFE